MRYLSRMSVRVSIALPVRNGENYLGAALASIASQTMPDYELVVCDNASEDATHEIALRHAALDPRVRVERLETNIGAAANFNRLVDRARAPVFKWAAHDDVLAPGYLQACISELDARPEVVCCHSETALIDATGTTRGIYEGQPAFEEPTPEARFASVITTPHRCFHVFGLIRTETLRQTGLIGAYTGSDRTLIAELALRGPLAWRPEVLFGRRDHPEASIRKHLDERARAAWFDPARTDRPIPPTWRRLLGYAEAIERAHLEPSTERACYRALLAWLEGWHQNGSPIRQMLAGELAPAPDPGPRSVESRGGDA